MRRSGWLARRNGFVPGLGTSPEVLAAAFVLAPGTSSPRIFEAGDGFALVQVLERKEPLRTRSTRSWRRSARSCSRPSARRGSARGWSARTALVESGELVINRADPRQLRSVPAIGSEPSRPGGCFGMAARLSRGSCAAARRAAGSALASQQAASAYPSGPPSCRRESRCMRTVAGRTARASESPPGQEPVSESAIARFCRSRSSASASARARSSSANRRRRRCSATSTPSAFTPSSSIRSLARRSSSASSGASSSPSNSPSSRSRRKKAVSSCAPRKTNTSEVRMLRRVMRTAPCGSPGLRSARAHRARCFAASSSLRGTRIWIAREQVARRAAARIRHALSAQAQARAAVGAGRDRERRAAVERRHLDLRAANRLDHVIGRSKVRSRPSRREHAVRPHAQHDREIARRPAADPGRALAGDPQPAARVDAGRNPHGDRLAPRPPPPTPEREPVLAAAHGVEEVELERRFDVGAAHAGCRGRPRRARRRSARSGRRDRRTRTPRRSSRRRAARRCRTGCRTPRAPARAFSASKPASSEIAPNSS